MPKGSEEFWTSKRWLIHHPSTTKLHFIFFHFCLESESEKTHACKTSPVTVTKKDLITNSITIFIILVPVIHPFSEPPILFRVVEGLKLSQHAFSEMSGRDILVRMLVYHRAQWNTVTLNYSYPRIYIGKFFTGLKKKSKRHHILIVQRTAFVGFKDVQV